MIDEAYIRIALTDGMGKWVPGTILGTYPLDNQFCWGDVAKFKIIRVTGLTDEIMAQISSKKLVVDFSIIATEDDMEKHRENLKIGSLGRLEHGAI